jgi:oxygen-independent coproporphyrinogen III oxidase
MRASASLRYLDALYAELEREPRTAAATFFFGGGTPNAYDATTLAELIARVTRHFPAAGEAAREVTVEVNPELVRDGDFERYREAGVTRASIGVQSFDAAEIATLGRKHTPAMVRSAVERARSAGLPSISVDLIFGVPGQTLQSWSDGLAVASALGVDHVSTYGLTIEEGTPYAAWHARDPRAFCDDALEAEFYETAMSVLTESGFEHYEISNFARPGHRCAHNENYWANGDYVGLGVGAASYRGGERSVHTRSLEEYVESVQSGHPIPGESERLAGKRRAGEAAMLALRTEQGVRLSAFKERYGIDPLEHYASAIARFSEAGLLETVGDHLRLTQRGRFLANDVCGAFITFE